MCVVLHATMLCCRKCRTETENQTTMFDSQASLMSLSCECLVGKASASRSADLGSIMFDSQASLICLSCECLVGKASASRSADLGLIMFDSQASLICLSCECLVGQASASRSADLDSIPAFAVDLCSTSTYTSDVNIGTPMATVQGIGHWLAHGQSTGTQ